jgi:hypothetical protein
MQENRIFFWIWYVWEIENDAGASLQANSVPTSQHIKACIQWEGERRSPLNFEI